MPRNASPRCKLAIAKLLVIWCMAGVWAHQDYVSLDLMSMEIWKQTSFKTTIAGVPTQTTATTRISITGLNWTFVIREREFYRFTEPEIALKILAILRSRHD